MNISELSNATIYLDDLADLTTEGSITTPKTIVIRETGGAVILTSRHYADFSGLIHLDLTDIFLPYAIPPIPAYASGYDSEQELELTITVDGRSYSFTLVLLHSEAATRYSDIDFLKIPDKAVPFSALVTSGNRVSFGSESSSGVHEIIGVGPCNGRSLAYALVNLPQVEKSLDCKFRLTATSGGQTLYSPMYQVQPGDWQMFLFRNRLGYLEYFPMCGDLKIAPSYQFNNAKCGKYYKKATSECSAILQQYTGPLTRKASKALAGMLEDGFAYHFADGAWRRIVIEDASINVSSFDPLQKQSFSFRYQDPITFNEMTM